ncbi:hypothetical protein Scep_028087 [Stephania cephalantha]|uniref:Uncharacterized protein n=1 Tax=Stephania cephalantha TaxID=152367 RepID=A0AAP0E961_9MAGN
MDTGVETTESSTLVVAETPAATERYLDVDRHAVVIIAEKGALERLGGGHSMPLPWRMNSLGQPPDTSSKVINLRGELKIKRQSGKSKKVLTPCARSDTTLELKPLQEDDLGQAVNMDSSLREH